MNKLNTLEEQQEWLYKMTRRIEELSGKKIINRTKEEMDTDTQEAWKQYNSGAIKERTKDVVDEDNIRKSDNTEPV